MVTKVGDSIMWEEFGYENNYENHVILDDYLGVGPFTFNAVEYERTLPRAIENLRKGASGSRVDRAQ
jgi:tRNA G37 N-methylase Trm5